ncbi:MAG: hypothetical protein OXC48_07930 [Endozoicomonadaceae bacterium]|nr:hypothetical protein [Endozoicomonadaceae bacterium]
MIKIIKWYILICTTIALLFGEIVQAGSKSNKCSSKKKKKPSSALVVNKKPSSKYKKNLSLDLQHTSVFSVSTGINEVKMACELQQACVIDQMDQAEKSWDYGKFNWVEVYPFLLSYIDYSNFILATRKRDSFISSLAYEMTVKPSSAIKTEREARLFIYSALHALYTYYVDNSLQSSGNFPLLQQVVSSLSGKMLQKGLTYRPFESDAEYIKEMLTIYAEHFVNNPEIISLQLTNKLADLVKIIDTYAKGIKPHGRVKSDLSEVLPTIEYLLKLYNQDDHPIVFACLLNYTMELRPKTPGSNPVQLQVETQLKNLITKNFKYLWEVASFNADLDEHLAKMAVFIFKINPLQDNFNQDISSASCKEIVPLTTGENINWDTMNSNTVSKIFFRHKRKIKKITATDTLVDELNKEGLFSEEEYTEVRRMSTPADRCMEILHCDSFSRMDKLVNGVRIFLGVLIKSNDETLKNLASKIYAKLEAIKTD